MSIKGSPLTHFRRAIELGDLSLIRLAAADLPRVPLEDALVVCVLMAEQDSPAFERAAVRWLARFALEARDVELAALDDGVGAFESLRTQSHEGKRALIELCADHGLRVRIT